MGLDSPDQSPCEGGSTASRSLRSLRCLEAAWRKVRSRSLTSKSKDIRRSANEFDQLGSRAIRSVQGKLIRGSFAFKPQIGVAKKRSGKSARPLVVAPIENRVVSRALLNTAYGLDEVKAINNIPTSFGGIQSIGEAIKTVQASFESPRHWYIRSDIRDFFTKIERAQVVDFIRDASSDDVYTDIFADAMKVHLENAERLAEDIDLFPTDLIGVAQGSSLSVLAGNIYLAEFDRQMNGRGITCVRYIDDFVIIGRTKTKVESSFKSAVRLLASLGLSVYDPVSDPAKAEIGRYESSLTFLGCDISPGIVQPSKANRAKLLGNLRTEFGLGLLALDTSAANSELTQRRYAQTIKRADDIVKGWSLAFIFCTGKHSLRQLDRAITREFNKFNREARRIIGSTSGELRKNLVGLGSVVNYIESHRRSHRHASSP